MYLVNKAKIAPQETMYFNVGHPRCSYTSGKGASTFCAKIKL